MPKVIKDFMGLSFYFWAGEKSGETLEPMHIHVSRGDPSPNATKVWLRTGKTLELCHNGSNLTQKELSKALSYIAANYDSIYMAWQRFFSLDAE